MSKLEMIEIPKIFLDKYLTAADPVDTVVYLYAYRRVAGGQGSPTMEEIAHALSLTEDRVEQAAAYWESKGLVVRDFLGMEFVSLEKREFSSAEIGAILATDPQLKMLFTHAEQLLGKVLSPSDMQKLCRMYSLLGLPLQVILLIINHAIDLGKPRLRYMEEIAEEWASKGIDTFEAANEYLSRREKMDENRRELKRALGIVGREFTKSETAILEEWEQTIQPSPELAAHAYDICVQRTGKFSMKYIDSILKSWHEKGIKTAEEALKEQRPETAAPRKQTAFHNFESRNNDMDGLQQRILERRLKKKEESR